MFGWCAHRTAQLTPRASCPLITAKATFALKLAEWFCLVFFILLLLSSTLFHQSILSKTPLIVLSEFAVPLLTYFLSYWLITAFTPAGLAGAVLSCDGSEIDTPSLL
jgi:hypothetical protein